MSLERKRIGLLGCGGFGAVELVEHAALGDTYALKAPYGHMDDIDGNTTHLRAVKLTTCIEALSKGYVMKHAAEKKLFCLDVMMPHRSGECIRHHLRARACVCVCVTPWRPRSGMQQNASIPDFRQDGM